MANMKTIVLSRSIRKVAVAVNLSNASWRDFLTGFFDYAKRNTHWDIRVVQSIEELERTAPGCQGIVTGLKPSPRILAVCDRNAVPLVAIGADGDNDGDLSVDEAAIVFGCDCGEWYRTDLCTGTASIICKGAAWDTPCLSPGVVGGTMLATTNYVGPMSVSFRGVLLSEVPCVHTNTPTGYFATNYTGQLTHWYVDFLGGAMAFRVKNGNYWTVDRAGHPGAYEDWSAGRLEWDIPIGWFRMLDEDDMMHVIDDYEYQTRRDTTTRPFLVGGRIDAYKQIFTISEDGTASVEKHGHMLSCLARW